MFILIQNVTFICVLHVSALLGQSLDMSTQKPYKGIYKKIPSGYLFTVTNVCVCLYIYIYIYIYIYNIHVSVHRSTNQ